MKTRLISFLALALTLHTAAQTGYEIKITLKPFKNQYIYLGHYNGSQRPIIDSAKTDANCTAVFKGTKKLPGGIYLVGYPNKNNNFEMLVDKQQHFSVVADTASQYKGLRFANSKDNDLFIGYQQYMERKRLESDSLTALYNAAKNAGDSARQKTKLQELNQTVRSHWEDIMKKNPEAMLTFILKLARDPDIPPAEKHPGGHYDSTYAYRYFKDHFWDGIQFFDERLARLPENLFDSKLTRYFETLVYPHADSVIKEMDGVLGMASVSPDVQKFVLLKFVNRYYSMKYMWEDKVFVHLYEKYFSQKEYSWLTEKGKKLITDRAYSLMANILGTPAADVELPDTKDRLVSLYNQPADYTLVCFWDATCGHCKETLPKIDSVYRTKWKAMGLRVFAVSKETDGTKQDWLKFIGEKQLEDWTHVFYSKEAEAARVKNSIPGYSQLYDVISFPTLYLLDKDKRIIAKRLSFEQIDGFLEHKAKKQ